MTQPKAQNGGDEIGQPVNQSLWLDIAVSLPELAADPEGAAHLVERFAGQYLPVLVSAASTEAGERAWLAFWSYVVAPRTGRKPFTLSSRNADCLIDKFRQALEAHGQSPPG